MLRVWVLSTAWVRNKVWRCLMNSVACVGTTVRLSLNFGNVWCRDSGIGRSFGHSGVESVSACLILMAGVGATGVALRTARVVFHFFILALILTFAGCL